MPNSTMSNMVFSVSTNGNDKFTVILAEEIDKLDLSRTDEREFRKYIEVMLNTLIDKVDQKNQGREQGFRGGLGRTSLYQYIYQSG